MAEKVNKAGQKTSKQGIVPNIIQGTAKVADVVSSGAVKGIRNVLGGKEATTLSPIEIEKALSKNLKTLQGK